MVHFEGDNPLRDEDLHHKILDMLLLHSPGLMVINLDTEDNVIDREPRQQRECLRRLPEMYRLPLQRM